MKKHHIDRITLRLLLSVTIPILAVAVALILYTVLRNYDYNRSTMIKNQEAVLNSVDEHIRSIQKETIHSVQSMEFLYVSNCSTPSIVSFNASKILSSLQESLSIYKEVVGVFLFNRKLDRTYNRFFTTENPELDILSGELQQPLPGHRKTDLIPVFYDGEQCLFYRIYQRYAVLAVLIRPSNNISYHTLCSVSDGTLFFSVPDVPSKSLKTITSVSQYSPLEMQYRIPSLISFTGLNGFQIFAIIVLFSLSALVIRLFYHVQNILLSPLLALSSSFREVTCGNTSFRISETSNIYEFDQFFSGFNTMLDSLHEAEAEAYRQQSEAEKAKMQYLQMQIRPHFYLNCLKTINFFAQLHEDDKIQSIVIALSNYFRYSFQDVNRLVTIQEELSSICNYVTLCRLLYSDIRLEIDVPEMVMDIPCLPLTILTFAENCIKHRSDDDEIFIRISAQTEASPDGSSNVLLTIQNNSPFADAVLDELNSAPPNAFQYKSHQVGIANVRYRMWLLYRGNCRLHFSNQAGLATVSLTFPIKPENAPETRLP